MFKPKSELETTSLNGGTFSIPTEEVEEKEEVVEDKPKEKKDKKPKKVEHAIVRDEEQLAAQEENK